MEACGFFILGGYLGVNIPRRRDARETPSSTGYVAASAACVVVWPRDDARVAAKDRRDHVRGARRSRTRGPSSHVDRSSAVLLWRDLIRRVRSWFLLPVGRADGVAWRIVRVWWALFLQKSCACPASARVTESKRSWRLGLCRCIARTRAKLTEISPATPSAAETAAHTRRNNSARDEGRATQRSNG